MDSRSSAKSTAQSSQSRDGRVGISSTIPLVHWLVWQYATLVVVLSLLSFCYFPGFWHFFCPYIIGCPQNWLVLSSLLFSLCILHLLKCKSLEETSITQQTNWYCGKSILNELIHIKYLKQCPALREQSVRSSWCHYYYYWGSAFVPCDWDK